MKNSILLFLAIPMLIFTSCNQEKLSDETVQETKSDYPIHAVDIRQVKLNDDFWKPMLQTIQQTTIPYAIDKCKTEGRFDNFLIAGGQMEGETKGAMPFDDSDVYKIIEGAAISLVTEPNPELDHLLDSMIAIIAVGQEPDGYITTWRTINPAKPPATWVTVVDGKRWESLNQSHELYNAGHMYEAAAAHYRATGKRNFLDIALKNADFICETFGDGEGQVSAVPGHQIIETGLIQLYRITGKEKYLDQAKYFLDNRGNPDNHKLYDEYINTAYTQDHIHPTKQEEVVGHAVRGTYMYAAMTDIAVLKNDSAYHHAVDKLWENMTYKKTYLTGGIGASREGEAFGENYDLPNKTGYSETCAAIGSVCWNHRLFMESGDVAYYDMIERTLYNGLISGISLDGTHFFYPNTLESDGKFEFNQGKCTRSSWFDCSCCPTNLIRFLPSVPKYIYATRGDTAYVNLYIGNKSTVTTENNELEISMDTDYPWNGKVTLNVKSKSENPITLKLRIPGWARNEVMPGDLYHYENADLPETKILIDGKEADMQVAQACLVGRRARRLRQMDGYFVYSGNFQKGVTIVIEFPMEVRQVQANEKVKEDAGKAALEYGPLVYAIEEMDNPNFNEITLASNESFQVEKQEGLLGGVNTIKSETLTAIPYYSWSNRGIGKMKVWMEVE